MPKGHSPKLKGASCNIPVEHVNVSFLLPRTADNNGLVIVKLRKKLEYKGRMLFEPVRTRFIVDLLSYLKRVNYLCKDITIVPEKLQSFVDSNEGCESLTLYVLSHLDELIEVKLTSLHEEGVDDNLETTESLLDIFRITSNETTLASNLPNVDPEESIIPIAPVKGQKPMSVLNGDHYEELVHPNLFHNVEMAIKLKEIYLSL